MNGAISNNEELARLFAQDQADRMAQSIDWMVVIPRDRAREARVKEFYNLGCLQTGTDYYHAAMILQHGASPDDYLLAHEFCIVAISTGEERAKWLAAATLDRFLMNIGRPQSFGTQYRSTGSDQKLKLYEVAPDVTDALRQAFNVPTLAQAREREQSL